MKKFFPHFLVLFFTPQVALAHNPALGVLMLAVFLIPLIYLVVLGTKSFLESKENEETGLSGEASKLVKAAQLAPLGLVVMFAISWFGGIGEPPFGVFYIMAFWAPAIFIFSSILLWKQKNKKSAKGFLAAAIIIILGIVAAIGLM